MNKLDIKIAVVGATGLVGRAMLEILLARGFNADHIVAVSRSTSTPRSVSVGKKTWLVQGVENFAFESVDIALFSAGSEAAAKYVPQCVQSGCTAIDNSSFFRMHADVPLVVPEVNGDILANMALPAMIANPNCSTIQLVVALEPIRRLVGLKRVHVATYQAASGAGTAALATLREDTQQILNESKLPTSQATSASLAFNVIPVIDIMESNGYTREEMKIVNESQKIFGQPELAVTATAVRVPTTVGHAEAVHLSTCEAAPLSEIEAALDAAVGVQFCGKNEDVPLPRTHAADRDPVFVGRLRQDLHDPLGINLWVVADNLRKGAALNAVQIAEVLVKNRF